MKIIETLKEWRISDALVLLLLTGIGTMLSGVKVLDILSSTTYMMRIMLFGTAFVLLAISLFFAINDYFDYELDKHANKTRNPLVSGKMSKNVMLALIIAPGAIAAFLTYLISLPVFILTMLTILSIMLYSARPFRFKEKFMLDLVSHSMPGLFLVIIGYIMFAPFNFSILGYAMVGFLFMVVSCINSVLNDYKTDKRFGLRTTVITIGPELSLLLSKVLTVMIAVILVLVFVKISLLMFLFAPLVAYAAWIVINIKKEDSARIDKIYHGLCRKQDAVIAAVAVVFVILIILRVV